MLSKQDIRFLKAEAHSLKPIFQVGKAGVNQEMAIGIKDALEHRELIKVSILQNCPQDKKEVAFDIQRLTNCEVIQIIGSTIVLYKKSRDHQRYFQ
ncbi:MAG: ribosome assembly RNA-binding protein YhbY [Erysipelotrichales bacterium]